jgi:hypothetical protein
MPLWHVVSEKRRNLRNGDPDWVPSMSGTLEQTADEVTELTSPSPALGEKTRSNLSGTFFH